MFRISASRFVASFGSAVCTVLSAAVFRVTSALPNLASAASQGVEFAKTTGAQTNIVAEVLQNMNSGASPDELQEGLRAIWTTSTNSSGIYKFNFLFLLAISSLNCF